MARRKGLREEKIDMLCNLDEGDFTDRERAGLRFAGMFSIDPREARPCFNALPAHFTPAEIVELAVFTAWQSNGLRTIKSWNAHEDLKNATIRLAYSDGPSLFVSKGTDPNCGQQVNGYATKYMERIGEEELPIFPPFHRPLDSDPEALWKQWQAWGTPPRAWLDFLSASPRALWGWSEFHRLTYGEGLLPRALKAKVLDRLAGHLDVPAWIPEKDLASERLDRESLTLAYADELHSDYLGIDDDFYAELNRCFTPGEVIELGNFIGRHLGWIKLAGMLGIH